MRQAVRVSTVRPTLVVVSGPAGCGKTTLAHELARALACPAISRDEIKEGMVRTTKDFAPTPNDELTRRTFSVFFEVLRLLLERGVTFVAEAAFQDHVWTPNLSPLLATADLRVVQCRCDAEVARHRIRERGSRRAHADRELLDAIDTSDDYFTGFQRIALDAPAIDVDTTSGYEPALDEVVAFIDRR